MKREGIKKIAVALIAVLAFNVLQLNTYAASAKENTFEEVIGNIEKDSDEKAAVNPEVAVTTEGEFDKGSKIKIKVNFKFMKQLYAAQIMYYYDNTLIKINSTSYNKRILGENPFIVFDEHALNGNILRFGYSKMGAETAFDGSGQVLTINATMLKTGKLKLKESDFYVQLIKKLDDSMEDMKFKLTVENRITMVDIALVAEKYNTKVGDKNWDESSDINKDGIVDLFDFVILARQIA